MIGVIIYFYGIKYSVIGKAVDEAIYKCPYCGNSTFGPRISKILKINDVEITSGDFSKDVLEQMKDESNLILAGSDESIRCGSCLDREIDVIKSLININVSRAFSLKQ